MDIVVIYCTVPNKKQAEQIAAKDALSKSGYEGFQI